MNYNKIYNKIIVNSRKQQREKGNGIYYEQHHIIPKCLNGTDKEINLVLLTAREHFLAHWLLVKIHKDDFRLVYALNQFAQSNCGRRGGRSHLYKYAREKYIELLKYNNERKIKASNSLKQLKWMRTDNDCIRIHKDSVEEFKKLGYRLGRIIEHRKPHSIETKLKISKSHIGQTHSECSKKQMSAERKQRKWIRKNNKDKFINESLVKSYLDQGWVIGRNYKRKNRNE